MSRACLLSLATAAPPHIMTQEDVARHAARLFAPRMQDYGRLEGIFLNAGIRQRHSARPTEWYLEQRGWPERSEAYLDVAGELFVEAAGLALERARPRGAD